MLFDHLFSDEKTETRTFFYGGRVVKRLENPSQFLRVNAATIVLYLYGYFRLIHGEKNRDGGRNPDSAD